MTHTRSLAFLALTFAFATAFSFVIAPDSDTTRYGATGVFLGALARTLGAMLIPAIAYGVGALYYFVKKKSFPENYVARAANVMALFIIMAITYNLMSEVLHVF